MIEILFPTLSQWLSLVFQHSSVESTFHLTEVTDVLQRARANKFEIPAQSEEQTFDIAKSKMEGLLNAKPVI